MTCKADNSILNDTISIERLENIPNSQSVNFTYNKGELYDKTKIKTDSIFLLQGNFNGKHTLEFINSYKMFPNVLHLKFNLNNHNLITFNPILEEALVVENVKKLDLLKFKKLKAITIQGYNYKTLQALINKIAQLPKLQLLTIKLEQHTRLKWDEAKSLDELYQIPDNFCELNIETLKFHGKYGRIHTNQFSRKIPYYGSINLPECVKSLKASKIVYEQNEVFKKEHQKSRKKYNNFKPNFEQFILHKNYNKLNNKKKLEIINSDGYYLSEKRTLKIFDTVATLYLNKRVGEAVDQHSNFIKKLLQVQAAEEITLKNAFIDSIPEAIKHNKNLKKLSILKSYLTYVPESIGKVPELEMLKIAKTPSAIHFKKNIKGFNKLKKLFLIDVKLSNGFPNLLKNKSLEELVYIGKKDVDTMPNFIGNQSHLKTLVWRYSNIKKVPEKLNKTRPKVVNLDNNKLEEIDAVLDMAKAASSFSYDINNIPYQKRTQYNTLIYPNGQLAETPEEKIELDTLFKIRSIPFNPKKRKDQATVINKIYRLKKYVSLDRKALKKEGVFKAIKNRGTYRTVSFKNSNNYAEKYRAFSNKDINTLEYYLNVIETYNIDPLNFFKIIQYDTRAVTYKSYFPIEEFTNVDTLQSYHNTYTGYEFLEHNISKGTFDYGKLKHLRKAVANGQEGIENVSKIKGLQYLEIKNIMEVKQIPNCFCELKTLDTIFVLDPERKKFNYTIEAEVASFDATLESIRATEDKELERYAIEEHKKREALLKQMKAFKDRTLLDYKHIKIPDCVKKMPLTFATYSGMEEK